MYFLMRNEEVDAAEALPALGGEAFVLFVGDLVRYYVLFVLLHECFDVFVSFWRSEFILVEQLLAARLLLLLLRHVEGVDDDHKSLLVVELREDR